MTTFRKPVGELDHWSSEIVGQTPEGRLVFAPPNPWQATASVKPKVAYMRRGYFERITWVHARATGWYAQRWTVIDPPSYHGPFRTWVGAARYWRQQFMSVAARHHTFAAPRSEWDRQQTPRDMERAYRALPKPEGKVLRSRRRPQYRRWRSGSLAAFVQNGRERRAPGGRQPRWLIPHVAAPRWDDPWEAWWKENGLDHRVFDLTTEAGVAHYQDYQRRYDEAVERSG